MSSAQSRSKPFQNSYPKIQVKEIAQVMGNGMLPGVPSEVEWLIREELPPRRPDVLQNIAIYGFFLNRASSQPTALIVAGLSVKDRKQFFEW
jgi:hypothetical protein